MSGIRAGLLSEEVTLLEQRTELNGFGEHVVRWVAGATLRARVRMTRGVRGVENGELWNSYTMEVTVRVHTPVSENHRVRWRGKDYHVVSVDLDVKRQHQVVVCELVNE